MDQLKGIKDVHHIVTDVTTEVSEVHPVYHDVPVDQFLGKLGEKWEYKPTTSMGGDQNVITYSSKTIEFEDLLCGNRKRNALLGDAGSGKSVSMRRLVKKATIANMKNSVKDEELLVFIEMKHLVQEEPMYIWEFIIGTASSKLEPDHKKSLFKWMINNEDKVTFLLDGLDQFPYYFVDNSRPIADYYKKVTIKEVLRDLFSGHLFRNSQMLFTSRPFALKKLPEDCWPNYITIIGGLTLEKVETLLKDMGGEACLSHFQNENLLLNMTNPLYLSFSAATYNLMGNDCPNTVTGVLLCVISNFLSCGHVRQSSPEILLNLCSLAFSGTAKLKVTFTRQDFETNNIDPASVGDLMISFPRLNFADILMQRDELLTRLKQQMKELKSVEMWSQQLLRADPEIFVSVKNNRSVVNVVQHLFNVFKIPNYVVALYLISLCLFLSVVLLGIR